MGKLSFYWAQLKLWWADRPRWPDEPYMTVIPTPETTNAMQQAADSMLNLANKIADQVKASVLVGYQVHYDDRPVCPLRRTWTEAAQDAVDAELGVWSSRNGRPVVKLDHDAEIKAMYGERQ